MEGSGTVPPTSPGVLLAAIRKLSIEAYPPSRRSRTTVTLPLVLPLASSASVWFVQLNVFFVGDSRPEKSSESSKVPPPKPATPLGLS